MSSIRMLAARAAGKVLPPVVAHVVANRLYPYSLGRAERKPFRIRSVTGSMYAGHTAEYHAHHFALHGYFDWRLSVIAATVCKRGDVIVEIGANVATETVGFADIVGPEGHVYAFEPFPANIEFSRTALAASARTNVTLIQAAVADHPGTLSFVAPPDDGMTGVGHLATGADAQAPADHVVKVEAVTLDEYFGDRVRARFVAMDVEGAEHVVIAGGREWIARWKPVFALEANAPLAKRGGGSLRALLDELHGFGYEVRSIRRLGLGEPDTSDGARPGNWLAIPREEHGLLATVDARLRRWGLTPFPALRA